jgi:surface protein
MSRRPTDTLVGQPASAGRLNEVLAAGLAHHAQRRPAPTDAPKRDIDSDDEESLPLTERPAYKRRKAPPPPPPDLLDALAGEPGLLVYILSFSGGMSCKEITQQCSTSKAFAQVCREDLFWMWQCQLRGYDREDRLFPTTTADKYWTPAPPPGMAKVPHRGSWREHYKWWCLHALDNRVLQVNGLVQRLFGTWDVPPAPPPYIDVEYGPIASWDVSQVTDMSALFMRNTFGFYPASTPFEPDLSMWDVSNVTDMSYMFSHFAGFNGDISTWDVSKVKTMGYMFGNCLAFNGDLSRWDVSNVRQMFGLFNSAISFNGDLSRWVVSSVTNMAGMFRGATSYNGGTIGGWDVSNVGNMNDMFYNARSFNGDLSRWNVSNVWVMEDMFYNATSFNGDLSRWNISNVKNKKNMFAGASSYQPPPGYALGKRAGAMEVG